MTIRKPDKVQVSADGYDLDDAPIMLGGDRTTDPAAYSNRVQLYAKRGEYEELDVYVADERGRVTRITNQGGTSSWGVDVRAHGAVGNGSTDDSAAFQAAFDAAALAGVPVLVSGNRTYRLLPDVVTMPDKSLKVLVGSGAVFSSEGAGATFTIPDGLTAPRIYDFAGLTASGDADADLEFFRFEDSSAFGRVEVSDYRITGFPTVVNFANGNAGYLRPARIRFRRGVVIPTALNDPGIKTVNSHGAYLLPAKVEIIDSLWQDPDDLTIGWMFDIDCDLALDNSNLTLGFLAAPDEEHSYCNGFAMTRGSTLSGQGAVQLDVPGPGYAIKSSLRWQGAMWDLMAGIKASMTDAVQLYVQDPHATVEDLELFTDAHLVLADHKIRVKGLKCLDAVEGRTIVEVVGNYCLIEGSHLRSTTAHSLIHNYGSHLRLIGNRFDASAGVYTVFDDPAGAPGDYTLGVGNDGVSTGDGLSLGANSKITIGDYNLA